MHDSSGRSATPCLIRLARSRWLDAWWLALHGLISAALILVAPGPLAGTAGLALVGWHLLGRRPRGPGLILLAPGPSFALPLERRFGLRATARSREGPGWLRLAFDDGGGPVLILADQLSPADWRRLRLSMREPG